MPARIEQCFGTLTKIPVKNMSGAELTKLVVKLRHSEVQKSRCGRDVVTWYSGVRKDWGPQPKKTNALGFTFRSIGR
jgi:hypothetical protein